MTNQTLLLLVLSATAASLLTILVSRALRRRKSASLPKNSGAAGDALEGKKEPGDSAPSGEVKSPGKPPAKGGGPVRREDHLGVGIRG